MRLVIDIPKEMYKDIKSGKDGYSNYIHTAIRNSTPLPKGHGRLVDIDEATEILINNTNLNDAVETLGSTLTVGFFNTLPTIIEAESEDI